MKPSLSRRSSSPALLAALLLALSGAGAHAADKPSRAAARRHFERGTALYQEARYAEAAAAFEAAYQAVANGVVLYNVGQCYEKLGDLPRAIGAYRDYLREVPGAEDRAAVETLVANLEARWEAQRRPRVSVASVPSGALLSVDGETHGPTPWTGPLAVGTHQLELVHEGYLPLQRGIEVRAGEPLTLELALSPAAVSARPPGQRLWTWVALGAAGAAAATGVTMGLLAGNDSRALLGSPHERAEATALRESALGKARAANIFYGVAGAAALAGGALFFVEGSF
jgi:tetratricopeptide (TPR) repeat protein